MSKKENILKNIQSGMVKVLKEQPMILEECAKKLGISRSQLDRWTKGDDLKMSNILHFIEVFNVEFEDLFCSETSNYSTGSQKNEINDQKELYLNKNCEELLNNYRERIKELKETILLQKEIHEMLKK